MSVLDRFLNYVSFETTALEEQATSCSNKKMLNLTEQLLKELQEFNPDEISVNRYGVIDAKFYGESSKDMLALLAHMDTSNQASGKDVKPTIVVYDGKDIKLNDSMSLTEEEFPTLKHSVGHKIIHTDGSTLLGGDDKAGIAIIMTALEDILKDKKHRSLEIIFTTDEEIGADARHVSMQNVEAKYGYTIDGGDSSFIEIESFSAYGMKVEVTGKSIHPGAAKDKMVNAANVLIHFQNALPEFLRPEDTTDKEPFFHLCDISGCEDNASATYIIRSFKDEQVMEMIKLAKLTAKRLNEKIGYEAIKLEFIEQYHNMKTILDKYPQIQKEMEDTYKELNIDYKYEPIRGGTTGSQLSFMGLPCPNLGTGDYNCHGRYEYVDLDEMELMVKVVKKLML
jgi:tripeptide aminopeptidase